MMIRSHPDAPSAGKSDPESIHMGRSMRFTMAWKACGESIGHAIAKPSAVSSKLISNVIRTASATVSIGEMNADQWGEDQQHDSLNCSKSGSAEHLS